MSLNVKFYDLNSVNESEFTRVICVSLYKDKWVFSKHKDRDTWEIPGGHIDEGENWLKAAKRELYEETGATDVIIEPVCIYLISKYGILCFAELKEIKELPDFEIKEIGFFDNIPENATYPWHKMFFDKVKKFKGL